MLLGLGEDVAKVRRKQYDAYRRLRNFACVTARKDKLLVYLRCVPADVGVEEGFTRDVTDLGHHGTGTWRSSSARGRTWSVPSSCSAWPTRERRTEPTSGPPDEGPDAAGQGGALGCR